MQEIAKQKHFVKSRGSHSENVKAASSSSPLSTTTTKTQIREKRGFFSSLAKAFKKIVAVVVKVVKAVVTAVIDLGLKALGLYNKDINEVKTFGKGVHFGISNVPIFLLSNNRYAFVGPLIELSCLTCNFAFVPGFIFELKITDGHLDKVILAITGTVDINIILNASASSAYGYEHSYAPPGFPSTTASITFVIVIIPVNIQINLGLSITFGMTFNQGGSITTGISYSKTASIGVQYADSKIGGLGSNSMRLTEFHKPAPTDGLDCQVSLGFQVALSITLEFILTGTLALNPYIAYDITIAQNAKNNSVYDTTGVLSINFDIYVQGTLGIVIKGCGKTADDNFLPPGDKWKVQGKIDQVFYSANLDQTTTTPGPKPTPHSKKGYFGEIYRLFLK
ncbi:unnamed protein product [Didymodactylos carnosus]|uniref:Uncharacterized protein n=2 Tax=Didymodactylos carnosus TaxID=1234261 RepID=A0A8S2GF30_9BILA|nr:unnamed protein product [Didymodactylos carnosus]CAF3507252.1 unnamed protein product [Didymodactylos carnosus]